MQIVDDIHFDILILSLYFRKDILPEYGVINHASLLMISAQAICNLAVKGQHFTTQSFTSTVQLSQGYF